LRLLPKELAGLKPGCGEAEGEDSNQQEIELYQ
jgi:hypothetical protein